MRAYPRVITLRNDCGWGYKRIAKKVELPASTVHNWLQGRDTSTGSCSRPNLVLSPSLSYLAVAFVGDGGLIRSSSYHYEIRLAVKDLDFAKNFGSCISVVLGRNKLPRLNEIGFYVIRIWSRLLSDYLANRREVQQLAEAYPAEFIRGFADAEGSAVGSVDRNGVFASSVVMVNTDRELLDFVGHLLLSHYGIASTLTQEKRTHRMWGKLPCYYLTIRRHMDQRRFVESIGFGMARKQERLKIAVSLLGLRPRRAGVEWRKMFRKSGHRWIRRKPFGERVGAPGGTFSE